MKRILFALLVAFGSISVSQAQLYAPCYANYSGIGFFVMPNGYYYGFVTCGFPHGEGYCYCVDPQLGPIYYHGYFDRGVVHGRGELLSMSGYICGTWNHGAFVSQIDVPSYQMQQSYTNAWSNYANCYAPTYSPSPSYSTPAYSYPCNSYPSQAPAAPNYQAQNNVKIPENTRITQIDSDTELGRQLLGKIGR